MCGVTLPATPLLLIERERESEKEEKTKTEEDRLRERAEKWGGVLPSIEHISPHHFMRIN